jgi:indolepyruvate ferredoxin oxidoreductase
MTFKILRNSAVAMTGGQRAPGELSLRQLVDLLRAEGVKRVVVTSDQPRATRRAVGRGVDVRDRSRLEQVQRELAAIEGVTVLVHDQECAAEKRRQWRRGTRPAPKARVFINERICEGCGDCGVKSSCLAVHPVDTPYGRKTRISQSACNVDLSCLAGDCPSFVTVTSRTGKQRRNPEPAAAAAVPEPVVATGDHPFTLRVTGIGGTGVVTVAQIVATAAMLVGKHVRGLDQTGLAQKGGPVVSDLVITPTVQPRGPRLAREECDLYLGCDMLVAAAPANLDVASAARTTAVVSTSRVPTAAMVTDPAVAFPADDAVRANVAARVRRLHTVDALEESRRLLSDEQFANTILLGAAYQVGAMPLSLASIHRAIALNGVQVNSNLAAFEHGRRLVHAGARTRSAGTEPARGPIGFEETVEHYAAELAAYQSRRYAAQYEAFARAVAERDRAVGGGDLARAVAVNLFKLMAYKDEYEVARLYLSADFAERVAAEFGDDARYRYHLHPPLLRTLGMRRKLVLGPWFGAVLRILLAMRHLRGKFVDPFGHSRVRRVERSLVLEYRATIEGLMSSLSPSNHALAVEIAGLPDVIRGYEGIKLDRVDAYHQRLAALLARYERDAATTQHPEHTPTSPLTPHRNPNDDEVRPS